MTAWYSIVAALLVSGEPSRPAAQIDPRIQRATVLLTVRDGNRFTYGSGTIAAVSGTDALIVTCGHTFEDTEEGAPVDVTLFSGSKEEVLRGHVLSYDSDRDVGLVLARGVRNVTPIPLASPGYKPRVGEEVVAAGCDRARPPSSRKTKIVALNRFLGPANIEVAAMPVDGRSGGGLFSDRLELVGVCNAREPSKGQGIYAGLSCVYEQLAESRIELKAESFACTSGPGRKAETGDQLAESRPSASVVGRDHLPPEDRSPEPAGVAANAAAARAVSGYKPQRAAGSTGAIKPGTEVICIVRSTDAPTSESRVILLNEVSEEFLSALRQEEKRNR